MLVAAFQGLVGERLQPLLVLVDTVRGACRIGVVVEQMDHLGEAGTGKDALARRGDLGAEVVEVGPRPLVHLDRVEVGAQHLAHADAVPLRAAPVGLGRVRRVGGAQVLGELGVGGVGLIGAGAHLLDQRRRQRRSVGLGGQRVEPTIRRPGAGLIGRGVRLASCRHAALGAAEFVRGLQAGERGGHLAEPRRDVRPGCVAVARHQVEGAAQRAGRCGDGPHTALPLTGVERHQGRVEPFGDEVACEAIVLVGHRQGVEFGPCGAGVRGPSPLSVG